MSTKVLGTEEILAATFQKLDERAVEALALLRLVRPDTSASVAKVLTFALNRDSEVGSRMVEAQQEPVRKFQAGQLTREEFHDAWNESQFIDALDVVEAMTDEERAELRARIVSVT
jgi:hypothetical protein